MPEHPAGLKGDDVAPRVPVPGLGTVALAIGIGFASARKRATISPNSGGSRSPASIESSCPTYMVAPRIRASGSPPPALAVLAKRRNHARLLGIDAALRSAGRWIVRCGLRQRGSTF